MPTPTRRPVNGRQAPAPVAANHVKFGGLSFLTAGFGIPEGEYALFFEAKVHSYDKLDGTKGQEQMGVLVHAYPLAGGPAVQGFYGMGKKALLSMVPDPDSSDERGWAKKILPIPNGPPANSSAISNFGLLLKSMYDSGLPEGVFEDDLSTIDGTWAYVKPEPAPESRKRLGAQTGEVAQEAANRGPDMVSIVTQILDDGKPWEGGGGMPAGAEEAAPAPAPRPSPAAAARPAGRAPVAAPKAVARPAVRAAAPVVVVEDVTEETEAGDVDLMTIAGEALAGWLGANGKGGPYTACRIATFNAIKKTHDQETASAVINEFFTKPEHLNTVLAPYGYAQVGQNIVGGA